MHLSILRRLSIVWLLLVGIAQAAPIQISVSLPPLQTIVEQLGGPRVQVQTLIRPGADPHHFQPTPREISQLAASDLYIAAGMPFERIWLPRLQATHPNLKIIPPPAETDHHAHGHSHEHDHTHSDPHFWTNPNQMRLFAQHISAHLARHDPEQAVLYQQRYAALATKLKALDQTIRDTLQPLRQRQFLVWHPAWGHFAAAYDLHQVALEDAGKQPGARSMAQLRQQAQNIRVILMQPQIQPRLVRQMATDLAIQVIPADPLAADYAPNLLRLAQHLAQALAP
jgi:zinc transport system substrate-binding protein